MNGRPTGTCKLCGAVGPLERSHLLPAWVYRRLRYDGGGNPEPVTVHAGRAVQSSRQVVEHALCRACEDRFQPDETYVAERSSQEDGTFPAFVDVGANIGDGFARPADTPFPMAIGGLDAARLVYFAASVVWRGHAFSGAGVPTGKLGERHGEAFRRFLLGGPPPDASTIVFLIDPGVSEPARLDRLAFLPTVQKQGLMYRHVFMVCGFYFEVCVGPHRPAHTLRTSVDAGHVFIARPHDIGVLRVGVAGAREATKSRRLAERTRRDAETGTTT